MNTMILDALSATGILADVLCRGGIVLIVSGLATLLLRNRSAALRSSIWSMSFVALLLLPILSGILPAWRVTVIDETVQPSEAVTDRPVAGFEITERETLASLQSRQLSDSETIRSHEKVFSMIDIHLALSRVWLLGAVVLLLRLGFSWLQLLNLLRGADYRVSADLRRLLADCRASLAVKTPVQVAINVAISVPISCGLRRPTILLPEEVTEWSTAKLESVLRHELGHIARRDYPLLILTEIIRAFYWINPLVWVAAGRSAFEREKACDDMALQSGSIPRQYARHLVDIAASAARRSRVATSLLMADTCGLRSRINHVLDSCKCRTQVSLKSFLVILTLFMVIIVPVSTMVPVAAEAAVLMLPETSLDEDASIPEWGALLRDLIDAPSVTARCRAAWWLGEHEDWDAVNPLVDALDDSSAEVRLVAAWALGEIKDPSSIHPLVETLNDSKLLVREMAVLALGEIEHRSAIRPLTEVFQSTPDLRAPAVWALGEIYQVSAEEIIADLDPSWEPANPINHDLWAGELRFSRRGSARLSHNVEETIDKLISGTVAERHDSALRLGLIGQRGGFETLAAVTGSVDALIQALSDPEPTVRAVAIWSLDEINPSREPHFRNR